MNMSMNVRIVNICIQSLSSYFNNIEVRTPKDCIEFGQEYKGTRSYTKKGVKCQAWNVNEPHEVTSSELKHFSYHAISVNLN